MAERTQKPQQALPDPRSVPAELRAMPRWVGWRWKWDRDIENWAKPPCSALTGEERGWPKATVGFDEALQGAARLGLDGIGFRPRVGDGLVFLDFDDCLEGGGLDPAVEPWLRWFPDAYIEVTPSGMGLRVVVKGAVASDLSQALPVPGSTTATVEVYSHKNYLTVTGKIWGEPRQFGDGQAGVDKLLAELKVKATKPGEDDDRPRTAEQIRAAYAALLSDFRAMTRPGDPQNDQLSRCAWFAARAFAAGALEGTEEQIKEELRGIARSTPHCPQIGTTLQSQWNAGEAAGPLPLVDPERELEAVDEWLADRGAERPSLEEAAASLASITREQYAQRRRQAARRLDVSASDLDEAVAARRPRDGEQEDELQGTAIQLRDPEPWPEPVDGAALLSELAASARRYVHFDNPADADTLAMWTVGSYCFDLFDLFPFLAVTAPEENSGKSTVLKWENRVARRPIPTGNITPAALFRLVAMHRGTMLIDETDTFLDPDSELYGILNSGHEKELAWVCRTVGEDHEPRRFSTWCPRAYAMIGLPKRTLLSRSLVIRLLRKPSGAALERLPKLRHMGPEWERWRRQCARWAADAAAAMQAAESLAPGLSNRAADNWEPLLAIAEAAGKDWPARARSAAGTPEPVTQEGTNTVLLRDVRNVFHTRNVDRIPAAVLALDLCRQEESPWPHYDHHNPMTVHQLGALLGALGVRSKPMKIPRQMALDLGLAEQWANKAVRGFQLGQFVALFASYLVDEEPERVQVSQDSAAALL